MAQYLIYAGCLFAVRHHPSNILFNFNARSSEGQYDEKQYCYRIKELFMKAEVIVSIK